MTDITKISGDSERTTQQRQIRAIAIQAASNVMKPESGMLPKQEQRKLFDLARQIETYIEDGVVQADDD